MRIETSYYGRQLATVLRELADRAERDETMTGRVAREESYADRYEPCVNSGMAIDGLPRYYERLPSPIEVRLDLRLSWLERVKRYPTDDNDGKGFYNGS